MIEENKVYKLLEEYKKHIKTTELKDELYKWEIVKKHVGKPRTDSNFLEDIKSIDPKNLINYHTFLSIKELYNKNSEEYKKIFKNLFNEQKDLKTKLKEFKDKADQLYERIRENKEYKAQHNETVASFFLTLHNPEKYTFYMDSYYKLFCEYLGIKPKTKPGEKYPHYLELIKDILLPFIKNDKVLMDLKKKLLLKNCEECYKDPNNMILAQDIIYQIFKKNNELFKISNEDNNNKKKYKYKKQYFLNTIFYGPPGTGKTYNTINRALEIVLETEVENKLNIGNKSEYIEKTELENILNESKETLISKDKRIKIKTAFDYYREKGQIEFITFHQSYSYEEFIEGIKPDLESDELSYVNNNGVFKEIVYKAKTNFEKSKGENKIDIDSLIFDFSDYVKSLLDNNEKFGITDAGAEIEGIREKQGEFKSFIIGGTVKSKQPLTFNIIQRDLESFIKGEINSPDDIKPSKDSKQKRHGNAIYYFALYEKIKDFYKDKEDIYKQKKEKLKNYVLIIDEINRGNISNIFGELITLIEEDKRIGEDEEIEIKLPYSGDIFGIPKNLYIIGTMNTADRSIALIDTALRRRFYFEEMSVNPNILSKNIEGINLQELLKAINERIEFIYDNDHIIGHSYFIKINSFNDLKEVFSRKIIPLLQEYFYDDWEKIRFVLNDKDNKFIKVKDYKNREYTFFNDNEYDFQEQKVYEISLFNWDIEAFKNIYKKIEQSDSIEEYKNI